jgi:hypothetical protein
MNTQLRPVTEFWHPTPLSHGPNGRLNLSPAPPADYTSRPGKAGDEVGDDGELPVVVAAKQVEEGLGPPGIQRGESPAVSALRRGETMTLRWSPAARSRWA